MAEKQNLGFVEQIREMRALRTQQLKGMTADQRFYNNMNANHRALLQTNQKSGTSFDSMSKTFSSSLRGLSSAVGGLASKGASAAGNVAGGAVSIAGSLASGIGKVLPFAIAGLLGKIFVYDNLTTDTKNRLSSSIGNLFSTLFGGLPDMFKGILQKIVDSVSKMDIKFPILNTIMEKTEILMKMFGAGIELVKLKFEDLMEFFDGIKDPMKIFESGLKAMGAATLSRLLLPATVSLVASIIGNRLLMGQIGDALDSRGVGGTRGSVVGGTTGRRGKSSRAQKIAGAAGAAGARSTAGVAAAKRLGLIGATSLGVAIPIFGQLALAGYTVYELYQIAKELGFGEDDADELSNVEPDIQSDAVSYYGETRLSEGGLKKYNDALKENESIDAQLKKLGNTGSDQLVKKDLEKKRLQNQDIINVRDERIKQFDMENRAFNKEGVLDSKLTQKFVEVWGFLKASEKQYAIDNNIPILESENFVYFYGKDGQIVQRRKVEYLDEVRKLPVVEQMSREEFQNKLANVIKPPESGAAGYNAFVFSGDKSKGSIPPPKNITEMTGEEVLEYQARLKESTKAAGQGKINGVAYGTSAVGAYQIVRQNLTNEDKTGYYDKNPGEKNKLFNEEQQDKIYRSLISGAVDEYMRTGDKAAFEEYVVKTWEAFKPEGSDARKQLQALLNNPTFTEGAGDSTKKQTKEQRAARTKIATQMFDDSLKKLMMPGNTTIATVGEKDVVSEGVKIVKNEVTQAMEFFQNIFQNLKPKNDATDLKKSETNSSPIINQNITNAPVSVVNSSSGGGGGAPSIGSVISGNMADRNWQFNALAGSSTK